jgi:hypothetical protein
MIVFKQNDLNVRVSLALYTADANQAPLAYKDFWYDHPKSILQRFIHS